MLMKSPTVGPLTLCLTVLVSGCTSCEHTRRTIVDPLNQLVHRDDPAALQDADVEGVRGLFAPGWR